MTEPLYRFVKGEGWVITPSFETTIVTTTYKTKIRLERRRPNIGEHYLFNWQQSWKLVEWAHYCQAYRSASQCRSFSGVMPTNPYGQNVDIDYVVLIDVD